MCGVSGGRYLDVAPMEWRVDVDSYVWRQWCCVLMWTLMCGVRIVACESGFSCMASKLWRVVVNSCVWHQW